MRAGPFDLHRMSSGSKRARVPDDALVDGVRAVEVHCHRRPLVQRHFGLAVHRAGLRDPGQVGPREGRRHRPGGIAIAEAAARGRCRGGDGPRATVSEAGVVLLVPHEVEEVVAAAGHTGGAAGRRHRHVHLAGRMRRRHGGDLRGRVDGVAGGVSAAELDRRSAAHTQEAAALDDHRRSAGGGRCGRRDGGDLGDGHRVGYGGEDLVVGAVIAGPDHAIA